MTVSSGVLAPRRVALFTGNFGYVVDGVSLTLNRLVAHLEARGTEVLVFAPTVDDPPLQPAGTLVPLPSMAMPGRNEYRLPLGLWPPVLAELERFGPSIVHVTVPDIVGFQALRWANRRNIPVVGSVHTNFISYLSYYHLGFLERPMWSYLRTFYARCDQVWVTTESIAGLLGKHRIPGLLRLWRRGVDASRFAPGYRSMAWRRGLGLGDEDFVIAYIGRLVREKNLSLFAEIIALLDRDGIPHRCLIVGDGPMRRGLERRLPQALFLGHLTGTDLATAYASSDAFLFPSVTETLGHVILEAMASGVPQVCADAPGGRDLVRHGVTGYLAGPDDPEAFMSYLKVLAGDPDHRLKMSRAAVEESRNHRWDDFFAQAVGYYADLLCRRGGEPS